MSMLDLFLQYYRNKKILGEIVIDDSPILRQMVREVTADIRIADGALAVRRIMDSTVAFLERQHSENRGCYPSSPAGIGLLSSAIRHPHGELCENSVWAISTAIMLACAEGLCGDIVLIGSKAETPLIVYCRLLQTDQNKDAIYCGMCPSFLKGMATFVGHLTLSEEVPVVHLFFASLGDI